MQENPFSYSSRSFSFANRSCVIYHVENLNQFSFNKAHFSRCLITEQDIYNPSTARVMKMYFCDTEEQAPKPFHLLYFSKSCNGVVVRLPVEANKLCNVE